MRSDRHIPGFVLFHMTQITCLHRCRVGGALSYVDVRVGVEVLRGHVATPQITRVLFGLYRMTLVSVLVTMAVLIQSGTTSVPDHTPLF